MKGIIISIEGTDGSGKHTQQQLMSDELKSLGYKVFNQSFPNYESPSSSPVKMYLDGEFGDGADSLDAYQASVLYAVDRLCTYKKTVKPHYENGEIVLFDRYVQSNFIHHCSRIKSPDEKEKYLAFMQDLEFKKFELPQPDLIIFIEMPVEKSLELARARGDNKHGKTRDVLEEDIAAMKVSYETGLGFAKRFGWTIVNCVDTNGNLKSIAEIHEEIMKKVLEFLKKSK